MKWIVKWNKHRMGFSLYPTTEQLYDEMPVNVENKLGFEIIRKHIRKSRIIRRRIEMLKINPEKDIKELEKFRIL